MVNIRFKGYWKNAIITYGTDGADYSDESDLGPAAISLGAPIEGWLGPGQDPSGGDRHVLTVDIGTCTLFELYNTVRTSNGFMCSSSARYNLSALNNRRPDGWTSADAAGLPLFSGLLRWEEAATGNITHATRFTLLKAQQAYTYPGNHLGTTTNVNHPPYGQRFRLKSSFSTAPYTGEALAIVKAWKKYGIIFADQGSNMYISGTSNVNWTNAINQINSVHKINGNNFEAVQSPYPIYRSFNPGYLNCSGVVNNTNPFWKPTIINDPTCTGNHVPPPVFPAFPSSKPNNGGNSNQVNNSNNLIPSILILLIYILGLTLI